MKKLMFTLVASAAVFAQAQEADNTEVAANEAELVQNEKPLVSIWGFGNYGIYSGYQLYGSLVNNEPTAQGYIDVNANIGDIGYVGLGLWSNTDLTKRRRCNELGQAFNEWDPNVHFGRTFWFDDNHEWGLEWRSTFVWFYYPPKNYKGGRVSNHTTWDFDHSFSLVNPSVIPYVTFVREYSNGANLIQFGAKKPFEINDQFSLTPSVELVWRERQYNWCFPTAFNGKVGDYDCNKNSGLATFKIQLDATYQFTKNFGVFAKVAYCSIIDHHLRNNCDDILASDDYGENKDFVWGGVGVTFNF